MTTHTLHLSRQSGTARDGLALHRLECDQCEYWQLVEVDERGNVKLPSKVKINQGDTGAAHMYTAESDA